MVLGPWRRLPFLLLGQSLACSSMVYLADTHVGENCTTSDSGYRLNDTDCYSIQNLKATVAKINQVVGALSATCPMRLVIVGGDVTSSAQITEFIAAKKLLDDLHAPYIPIMGNHDVWSYDQVTGDLTPTPVADTLFAGTFSPNFAAIAMQGGLVYPNASTSDPELPEPNATVTFQSWELRPAAAAFGSDLEGLVLLAPDFNTRRRAPPPCPGHSPVGGCGVPGNAHLHDFEAGVLPWFRERIGRLAAGTMPPLNGSVLLFTHQPFRCRAPVPDAYFCFSSPDQAKLREAIDAHGVRAAFWGQLAGHQHRWYNGNAFDEPEWKSFRQWENSAVKGDQMDTAMTSSFSVLQVEAASIVGITRHWKEDGRWMASS
mmetsp:Transcript_19989/g.50843  ORF Transcript_19989/g.50843 Transcript_19989/m.50843 type:complete len:373 (-) Transcript_19989:475-1593(-)